MERIEDSDEELMLRFGRGDAAAFETLYGRHEGRVFRYLYRHLRNHAGANDVMQDVWFAVARSAQGYVPSAKFTTWLFTLAHHRMVDHFRRSHPAQSLDAAAGEGAARSLSEMVPADARHEPLAQAMSESETRALLRAVELLPPEQKSAFLLQAEGGLSLEEIALATEASVETVKSRLRYARAKLRQLLWEHA
jgi:RNA polymerase sigma factor (sigma-70 family)